MVGTSQSVDRTPQCRKQSQVSGRALVAPKLPRLQDGQGATPRMLIYIQNDHVIEFQLMDQQLEPCQVLTERLNVGGNRRSRDEL